MRKNHYNPFTLGKTVFDIRKYDTPGTVTEIVRTDLYPVKVSFTDGSIETYDYNGKSYHEDSVASLYTEPMTVTPLKTKSNG